MYDISKNKPLLYPEMLIKIRISKCSQPTKYWCVSKIHTLPSFQNPNNCSLQFLLFFVIPVTNCTAYYWVLFFNSGTAVIFLIFNTLLPLSYFQCIASFWVWVQFSMEKFIFWVTAFLFLIIYLLSKIN